MNGLPQSSLILTNGNIYTNDESQHSCSIIVYTSSGTSGCATLLHEQCHLYNLLHGIKDTSNHNRYHNKRFKKVAEEHGLIVEYYTSVGWSKTSLSEETKAYVKKLNIKTFKYRRKYVYKGSNLRRFSCPICNGPKVYSIKDQGVLCGNCKIPLVYIPTEKVAQE